MFDRIIIATATLVATVTFLTAFAVAFKDAGAAAKSLVEYQYPAAEVAIVGASSFDPAA